MPKLGFNQELRLGKFLYRLTPAPGFLVEAGPKRGFLLGTVPRVKFLNRIPACPGFLVGAGPKGGFN